MFQIFVVIFLKSVSVSIFLTYSFIVQYKTSYLHRLHFYCLASQGKAIPTRAQLGARKGWEQNSTVSSKSVFLLH